METEKTPATREMLFVEVAVWGQGATLAHLSLPATMSSENGVNGQNNQAGYKLQKKTTAGLEVCCSQLGDSSRARPGDVCLPTHGRRGPS